MYKIQGVNERILINVIACYFVNTNLQFIVIYKPFLHDVQFHPSAVLLFCAYKTYVFMYVITLLLICHTYHFQNTIF